MRKMKSGLLLILAVLSVLFMTQCKKGGDSQGSDGETVQLTGLFVSHPLTKSIDELKFLEEMEAAAGVTIEWEQIYGDWNQTKAARFASGDIPDIMINATIPSDYSIYNGLFQELTELIASDAPNVQTMFIEEPDTKVLVQTYEGEIYGLPKFQGKWPYTTSVCFINQEWLDNLGLEAPTTFHELDVVLTAFKEKDANGNGDPDDEVPMDFNGWYGAPFSIVNMINSFGIQTVDFGIDGYFSEEGIVKNYLVDDRYKAMMSYFAGLYAKGLINENAITNDYGAFQSLSRGNADGDSLVGVVYGWEETDKFGPNLHTQYVPLAPLDYDIDVPAGTYDTRWPHDYSGLNMSTDRIVMSAMCENKEAAMRFMDMFYDKSYSVQVLFGGITDGCVEQIDENTFKVLPPLDPDTDSGTWKWTNAFADWGPMYVRRNCTIDMTQDMTYALEERETYSETLAKLTDAEYYPAMFMKYTADEQNEMAMLQANIGNLTNNYWALWMTGETDIDAEWDDYVAAVNEAGLPRVLELRQKAFDVYKNN